MSPLSTVGGLGTVGLLLQCRMGSAFVPRLGIHIGLTRSPPQALKTVVHGSNLEDLALQSNGYAQKEAERIMKELEQQSLQAEIEAAEAAAAGPKYMPTTEDDDPIVQALKGVLGAEQVESLELLDSRWNGNEVFKYVTSSGPYFVKINRVEDPSVFLTEAVSLSAIAKTETIVCPRPLHLGRLPKVGDIGPGAFMVLDYLPLKPFGILRSDMQQQLGLQLAALHMSHAHDDLHMGRFGFPVSNFLALTPLDNTWHTDWPEFFTKRLEAQVVALYKDKTYGRPALNETDTELRELGTKVMNAVPHLLSGVDVKPSLIHGDLWVGNAGATEAGPVIFDPACFFGHHEMELAMMTLFGGFRDDFWLVLPHDHILPDIVHTHNPRSSYHSVIPRADGFDTRHKLYQLYYYLNQLNLFGAPDIKVKCTQLATELLTDVQA